MKIVRLETFLTNAGFRNYLFIRLTADNGLTGVGEASLEWQEKTVETLIYEWVEERILGADPFEIESVINNLIRDQYQGGSTIMTAISGIEVALWDIVGKACGQPIYKMLGGRSRERLQAYANGWYGGARTPAEYAQRAREAVARGYKALKFDPFGTAWQNMTQKEMEDAEALVAAVRGAVGDGIEIMIEVHGRLSASCAIEMGRRLEKYRPAWFEEPVTPNSLDLLAEVKKALPLTIAAGERLYTIEELHRLTSMRACDVVQMDPSHCGGLQISKKVASMAEAQGMMVSPHCSVGPVALCAALHLDWTLSNIAVQENFAEYDVPWRNDLVFGWNPILNGEFVLPEGPGLGIDINTELCASYPYRKNSFPSLWENRWYKDFTQSQQKDLINE